MKKYRLKTSNNVLEIGYEGRPKDSEWEEFFCDYKNRVMSSFDTDWALYADMQKWDIPTPGFASRIQEMHLWNLKNQLTTVAFLVRDDHAALQQWAINHYVFKGSNIINFEFFNTKADALTWLNKFGYCWQ